MLIALDRMERGGSDDHLSAHSAVEDFERDYGLPVIVDCDAGGTCCSTCSRTPIRPLGAHFARVAAYRERYGV